MKKYEVIYSLKIGEPNIRLTISADNLEQAQECAESLIDPQLIFSITEIDE